MTITGLIKLFVETKKGKENTTFQSFSTSVSTKVKDTEEYINKSLEVRFSAENFKASDLRRLQLGNDRIGATAIGNRSPRQTFVDKTHIVGGTDSAGPSCGFGE